MHKVGGRQNYQGSDSRTGRKHFSGRNFMLRRKDYAQILELDNKFHEVLYEASGSKMLKHELSAFSSLCGKSSKNHFVNAGSCGKIK